MKLFQYQIRETLVATVCVRAETEAEASERIKEMYESEGIDVDEVADVEIVLQNAEPI